MLPCHLPFPNSPKRHLFVRFRLESPSCNILPNKGRAAVLAIDEAQLHSLAEKYVIHFYFYFQGKRVEGDDKYKGLAMETFGMSMSAQSNTLPEGSSYREALRQMGDAHQGIGAAQGELVRPNNPFLISHPSGPYCSNTVEWRL